MKTWQKVSLMLLAVVLIAGIYLFFVMRARRDPGVVVDKGEAAKPISQDDLAVMKQYYFATFDQAKQLEGTNVWIRAGYTLPYYPYEGGTVAFDKRVGVLPSAEKLSISKLIKAVVPAKEDNRVPHGSKQYFALFTMPGPDGKAGTFAAPFGYAQGENEGIFCDQLFYYDDPKTIYDNWPKPVWDAVAAHEPKTGMSELQTQMAVGILMDSDSKSIGNRTVTYDDGGKKWTVTFRNNAATEVKAG